MIFSFENLGVISKGEIELGDLTILCGANNTGKTYITYALYGLLKNQLYISLDGGFINNYKGNIEKHLSSLISEEIKKINGKTKDNLNYYFPTNTAKPINIDLITENEVNSLTKSMLDFHKTEGQGVSVSGFPHGKPFIISAERTGAVLFQQELNLAKSRLVDLFSKGEKVDYQGYAVPVRDNIDFMNSLDAIKNQKSFLVEEHPEIIQAFDEIAGGNYQFNNGSLRFKPDETTELSMNGSSSAVRSLVILGYYLKHIAEENHVLMIDEPELNLHPANQRKLTRLLASLVNVGIKVFMTTHSDYIVKEFNTLIMLSNKEIDENKWGYNAKETLTADKVRVYTLQYETTEQNQKPICTVKPANISPTLGIEVSTFDQTIDEMNAIQDEIYYDLREKI